MSLYYCDDHYYEECVEPESGWIREEDIPSINDTRDFLQGIIEALYETGDVYKLEGALDELCCLYDMQLPSKQPKLQGKRDLALMDWYLEYQKALIKRSESEVA